MSSWQASLKGVCVPKENKRKQLDERAGGREEPGPETPDEVIKGPRISDKAYLGYPWPVGAGQEGKRSWVMEPVISRGGASKSRRAEARTAIAICGCTTKRQMG
ncbi:hypothetical protein S7711_10417 [Stachybotrys chartarum IBT 7711]|jgi:hypothetical protein|uniref:Uncharacterized protein n=1 Tax=Stachybotrys chartarum (strain CBS 109288 / IBT 7711) TaxID=1280523 RepID=A0A084B4C1_STACB|nr:hypothetical protein S7711_10417 [Stachybotrys chartarum IBT 7711]